MACAVVAAAWTKYFNEFLKSFFSFALPDKWCNDPFTHDAFLNLPAAMIVLLCTVILVTRHSQKAATTNAILVAIKLGVVLFVIGVGLFYVSANNWIGISPENRISSEDKLIPGITRDEVMDRKLTPEESKQRIASIVETASSDGTAGDGKGIDKNKLKQMIEQLYLESARAFQRRKPPTG